MPIYEFYCPDCHTVFSFFSRAVNTSKTPSCPSCQADILQRRVSRFAVTGKAKGGQEGEQDDLPIDESKMEAAMGALAGEAENINEDDPRAAARLMRKFSDMTGLHYSENMESALGRMEAGEDPEAIEADMGDILENEEEPFVLPGKSAGRRAGKPTPPKKDDTLYEM
ncbi:MAG: zinc ribbon domain-containing protein [Chitinivibrionales bacterium]|nr:zinc ribbon domain-containing protein [Chitinivibrionales bacterium]MBD3357420.1 zinc ribbon domain-containing protein [Chitinivibrionales bacterium]